jgi:hypothetical protein
LIADENPTDAASVPNNSGENENENAFEHPQRHNDGEEDISSISKGT